MEIKQAPGQTLLTLLKLVIFSVAVLCSFGMHSAAESFFGMMADPDEDISVSENAEYILYYEKDLGKDNYSHIYRHYYITGNENAYGLTDASGTVLLEEKWQEIKVLPESFLLKAEDKWGFYSAEQTLLNEQLWDNAEISINEKGKLVSNMVKVSSDGLFGITDLKGNIMIKPQWDSIDPYSATGKWPLIRVSQEGSYGYIDHEGDVAVRVRYDYAQMGDYVTGTVLEDGSQEIKPAIYVCQEGDWGAIFKDRRGEAGSVDWSIDPPQEILDAYAAL